MQWKRDKQGREREKRRKERKRDTAIYLGLNVKWRHRFALREGDEVMNIFKISSFSSDAHIYSLRPSFSLLSILLLVLISFQHLSLLSLSWSSIFFSSHHQCRLILTITLVFQIFITIALFFILSDFFFFIIITIVFYFFTIVFYFYFLLPILLHHCL